MPRKVPPHARLINDPGFTLFVAAFSLCMLVALVVLMATGG
jgi:hypothetical protein